MTDTLLIDGTDLRTVVTPGASRERWYADASVVIT